MKSSKKKRIYLCFVTEVLSDFKLGQQAIASETTISTHCLYIDAIHTSFSVSARISHFSLFHICFDHVTRTAGEKHVSVYTVKLQRLRIHLYTILKCSNTFILIASRFYISVKQWVPHSFKQFIELQSINFIQSFYMVNFQINVKSENTTLFSF